MLRVVKAICRNNWMKPIENPNAVAQNTSPFMMSALDPRWNTGMCSKGAGTVTLSPPAYVSLVHQYVHGFEAFEPVIGKYTVHSDTFASVTGAMRRRGPNIYLDRSACCTSRDKLFSKLTAAS